MNWTKIQTPHLMLIFLISQLIFTVSASAQTHPKVQDALDWKLPSNPCKKPKGVSHLQKIEAKGGYIRHSPTNTSEESGGAPTVFDIDHYKIKRYERRKKKWDSCVENYRTQLLTSFARLKESAQYGLTKPQANNILKKLAQIQAVVLSPEGIIDSSTSPISNEQENYKHH